MLHIHDDSQLLCLQTTASSLINKRIAEIEARVESGQSVEGLYLTYLLSSNKLSRSEIYTCITEMLLGGVDTVSSRISRDLPEIQAATEQKVTIRSVYPRGAIEKA